MSNLGRGTQTTFVQSASNGSTGAGTTLAASFSQNVLEGSTILVFLWSNSVTPTSVTDSNSNTYTRDYLNTAFANASSGVLSAYRFDSIAAGSLTVTANFASNSLPRNMIIVEHKYLLASSFDQSANAGLASGTALSSGSTATLAQNFELVVGISAVFNGLETFTAGAGFSNFKQEQTGSTSYPVAYEDMLNNASTASTSFTRDTSGSSWGVGVFTYKITGSFGSAVNPNNLRPHAFSPGLAR